MSAKPLHFRPTVQTLEHRRCLTGILGTEDLAATPTEPAGEPLAQVTITDSTISGNTAGFSGDGGGILNIGVASPEETAESPFFAYDPGFLGGVRVASGDINGDGLADIITGAGPGGGPHVEVIDGTSNTLLIGETRSGILSAESAEAADSLFAELGRNTTNTAVGSHEITGAVVRIN